MARIKVKKYLKTTRRGKGVIDDLQKLVRARESMTKSRQQKLKRSRKCEGYGIKCDNPINKDNRAGLCQSCLVCKVNDEYEPRKPVKVRTHERSSGGFGGFAGNPKFDVGPRFRCFACGQNARAIKRRGVFGTTALMCSNCGKIIP